MIKGTHVRDETVLHEKYGPIVRTGPNILSFSGGSAWKGSYASSLPYTAYGVDIYGSRPGKKQLQKDPKFYQLEEPVMDIICKYLSSQYCSILNHTAADDSNHSRIRKLLSHAFSDAALREQEALMTHYFDLLVEKLKEQIAGHSKGKVDIMVRRLVICQYLLSIAKLTRVGIILQLST